MFPDLDLIGNVACGVILALLVLALARILLGAARSA
jgi:hypothetical protein